MVKDHVASEIGNPLPLFHGLCFSTDKDSLQHHTQSKLNIMDFGIPVVGHWLEQKKKMPGPLRRIDPMTENAPDKLYQLN